MITSDIIIICCVVAVAIIFDMRERRIPNLLLLIGLIIGVTNLFLFVQDKHVAERIGALFLGMGLLFIPFALGGIGAGDVKLLGLIGFFTGVRGLVNIALLSFVLGGIISIVCVLIYRLKTYRSVKAVMASLVTSCMTRKFLTSEEGKLGLPYSLPLGIGTALVLLLKWGVL